MKRTENLRNDLRQLFEQAKAQGLVKTQADFARLVGYNPANMSSLMTGALPVSERAMYNIENALAAHNIVKENSGSVVQEQKNFTQPATDRLLDEMKAQRELFAAQLTTKDEQIKSLMALLSRK